MPVTVAKAPDVKQTQPRRGAPKKEKALTAQINVRMDTSLKEAADAAFAAAGLSSSEVIRAVYERAAELGGNLRGMDDLVRMSTVEAEEDERTRKMRIFERSTHAVERAFESLGLHYDPTKVRPMTEEEFEAQIYEDFIKGNL